MLRRCVPAGMRRGAVAGFALLVVAAMGVWGAYGRTVILYGTPACTTLEPTSC